MTLRGGTWKGYMTTSSPAAWLRTAPESAEAGDLLLVRAGPAQLHLVLCDGARLSSTPTPAAPGGGTAGPVPWPVLGLALPG